MRRSLRRVAALRHSLHQHAELLLGVAQRELVAAEASRHALKALVVSHAAAGELPLSVLELSQLAAAAAETTVGALERRRDRCAEDERHRALEHRQLERLVERAEVEDRVEEGRRSQRALDEWTLAKRSRR
ncbi:MAG: hypothetical protein HY903_09625 [Deltaproteobacteria bacterium]|nr:hypothetical protein [Deltaproteobacteria bacterium]